MPSVPSVPSVPPILQPLLGDPGRAALFLDFDGTLAPIVADPATARPVAGAPALLARLAERLSLVAVVSGRPAAFLARTLGPVPGVRVLGLYGLESVDATGTVRLDRAAEPWRGVVAGVTAEARLRAPQGIGIEEKGVTVTIHWRGHVDRSPWAVAFCEEMASKTGLALQPARMALELRPPIATDKGTVIDRLVPGCLAVACFGDDVGDLAAFAALDRWALKGMAVAKVAVVDDESPEEVVAAADLVVQGPAGALELLGTLSAQLVGTSPA
jgi:trehalose 6-phosphate phosphatase